MTRPKTAEGPSVPTADLGEAWWRCHPRPLEPGSPWYVDCSDVRGGANVVELLCRRLDRVTRRAEESPIFLHDLVSGHRGCGKSTELGILAERARRQGFLPVVFAVDDEIDLENVEHGDLLLAILRRFAEGLLEYDITVDRALLEQAEDWLSVKIEQRLGISRREYEADAEAGVGASLPLLRLLARFRGAIRNAEESRTEIRRMVQDSISALVGRINEIMASGRREAQKRGYRDVLLIADNMERISPGPPREGDGEKTVHDVIFVDHGHMLRNLHCHTVYTLPISLYCSPKLEHIRGAIGEPHVVPMIDIYSGKGSPKPGVKKLLEILAKRVDVKKLFAPRVAEFLCGKTGGHVRHLMEMVQESCDATEKAPIGMEAALRALRRRTHDYNWIAEDDYPRLARVHVNKDCERDPHHQQLLFHTAILAYADDPEWYDVHPAVLELKKFKEALSEAKPNRPRAKRTPPR